ncbi:MAG: YggS family pyridoxal phosphate-dependent enzyme [Candidatus Longimicrobiales bacterium M2_2A_002]
MWDSQLKQTVPVVRERIDGALARAGRDDEVRIVAVTKGHPVEAAGAAVRAGLTDLGENRVDEMAGKVEVVGRDAARWHMIGHLQRNKARDAVPLFDVIHSVDSMRLARKLSKEAVRAGTVVRGYMQVNVSGEESKGGFGRGNAVASLEAIAELGAVEIHGLMTMAPYTDDERVLRDTFRRTRELLDRCRQEAPGALSGRELSMGMSNDFEIAIEEGATCVRLGTVLFGERENG